MRNFILDTNILIAYLKANPLFTKVSEDNNLNDEDAFIMISSISKGELLSLAMQNNWGERRVNILNKLLSEVVIIDVAGNDDNLLNAYAEIDAFSLQRHPTKKLSGSANANPSQPHTLPSRTSQRYNPSLAKSVSVQPHHQNDRQTNGRRRTPNR
jgi:hypothetical protein